MMQPVRPSRSSAWRLTVALAAAVSALPLAAQRPAPLTTPPQWLNADTSKKVNQSNFRAVEQWPTPN